MLLRTCVSDCLVQEKNVGTDSLEGKVGRMYVPRQEVGSIALRKMKVRVIKGAKPKHAFSFYHIFGARQLLCASC